MLTLAKKPRRSPSVMLAKRLSLSAVAKPVHSFREARKGWRGLRKDRRKRRVANPEYGYLHAGLNAQYASSQMARKWWKSTCRRFNDAAVDKREEGWPEKKIWNRETTCVTRYGSMLFLVALSHSAYTRNCRRNIDNSFSTEM